MAADPVTFNHILGQGRVNQLGGVYINGRPLHQQVRVKIIELANSGVKPCQISRQLRVSHGAVSKILNRFQETGSISPGQIGGNPRQRTSVQSLEKHLLVEIEEKPHASASEIRQSLIEQGICSRSTAPTTAAISRFIRSRGWAKERRQERKKLSHSIDSILGISSDSSSSEEESPDARRNRTSFTTIQLETLEAAFRRNTYPDEAERKRIAIQTGLSEDKITTWFSNRRARCRKHIPLLPLASSNEVMAFPNLPVFLPAMAPVVFSPFIS